MSDDSAGGFSRQARSSSMESAPSTDNSTVASHATNNPKKISRLNTPGMIAAAAASIASAQNKSEDYSAADSVNNSVRSARGSKSNKFNIAAKTVAAGIHLRNNGGRANESRRSITLASLAPKPKVKGLDYGDNSRAYDFSAALITSADLDNIKPKAAISPFGNSVIAEDEVMNDDSWDEASRSFSVQGSVTDNASRAFSVQSTNNRINKKKVKKSKSPLRSNTNGSVSYSYKPAPLER